MAFRLGLEPPFSSALIVLCAGAGLWCTWRVFRAPANTLFQLGALGTGYMLCSPYALAYEMALVAPVGAAWLLNRKLHPAFWVVGGLALTSTTGQYGSLPVAPFTAPLIAIMLLASTRRKPMVA
jgi:hypothetical protein